MALLEVDSVDTYYGRVHALQGVSLSIEEGEIVTLIGSNGAGKTTTLRTISGLTPASRGRFGCEARTSRAFHLTRSSGWASVMFPRGDGSSTA
jgi:ABC-type branched-subunit amino acid transport system ATPase component